MSVSREEFQRYVDVQNSGVVNMLSSLVQDLADISKAVHMDILKNYDKYEKEYDIHPFED